MQFLLKLLLFLLLVLFAGLRSFSVGTDTNAYINFFLINNGNLLDITNYQTSVEIGYKTIETLISSITSNPNIYLCLVSAIFVYFQLKSIYKISQVPFISIFILLTWGIYFFSFNGLRQGIAASIYLIALPFLLKGNFKKYLLIVLIAFLFHKSVIITLPLYFLFRIKFGFKFILIVLVSAVVLFLYSKQLLDTGTIISDKYEIYTKMQATGGRNLTALYFLLSIFFIFFRRFIKQRYLTNYDVYLKMLITGALVFIIVTLTSSYVEITRIAIYFTSVIIFIWPIIFKSLLNKAKPLVFIVFLLINMTFFYTFTTTIGNLVPYKFFI